MPGRVLAMKDSLAWARGIELICVLLSALLAAGLLPGASPATCAAPFLFGVAVRVGYPPAGKGVGQPAPSLAEGLEVVSGSELGAADRGGEGDGDGSAGSRREGRSPVEPWHLLPKASLAAGKVHVLVFCGASLGPRIVTALRRVQAPPKHAPPRARSQRRRPHPALAAAVPTAALPPPSSPSPCHMQPPPSRPQPPPPPPLLSPPRSPPTHPHTPLPHPFASLRPPLPLPPPPHHPSTAAPAPALAPRPRRLPRRFRAGSEKVPRGSEKVPRRFRPRARGLSLAGLSRSLAPKRASPHASLSPPATHTHRQWGPLCVVMPVPENAHTASCAMPPSFARARGPC